MPKLRTLRKSVTETKSMFKTSTGQNIAIVTKGDTKDIIISEEYMDTILDYLYRIKDSKLYELNEKDMSFFNTIVMFSRVLHNTESYPIFHDIVDEKFKNVTQAAVFSIAWYMRGYTNLNDDIVKPACSVNNNNTLPPVNKAIDTNCEHSVIVARYDEVSASYIPTPLSTNSKSNKAYLYIKGSSITSIPKFTTSELNKLKNLDINGRILKIDSVILCGYNEFDGKIERLIDREIKVDELPTRPSKHHVETNDNTMLWIIAAILIIFLIIIIVWALYQ